MKYRNPPISLFIILFVLFSIIPISAQTADTFTGTLNNEKTFYEYPLLIEEDNTTIIADSIATSGDLDTILYLLDDAGNVLSQNDNRVKGDLNAYIEYPSAVAGAYTLILARYDLADGETSGDFSFTITLQPTVRDLPPYDISPEALSNAGYPTQDPKEPADWTILVYYGGDNNLEGSLINDLKEFELVGAEEDNIHIVAFLDRSTDHSDVDGNWSGARLYEVTTTGTDDLAIDSTELANLGEVNSADGLTLAQFLAWGIRHYPAEQYAIAFGSHGAGWAGIIADDTNKSMISLPEIDHAFKTVQPEINEPFALVINDACLMSSVEYHVILSRYALKSYASPEIVLDPALNMTDFTTDLEDVESLNEIGVKLVNRYIDVDVLSREGGESIYMTNAVTTLTAIPDLENAIDEFAILVLTDPLRYSPIIGGARNNAYTYTAFSDSTTLIDLGSFMRQVVALSDNTALIDKAQAVIRALDRAVPYSNGGDEVQLARILYQNIYFPKKAKDFKNVYFIDSPLISWGEMLRTYYNTFTPKVWDEATIFHAPTEPALNIMSYYPTTPTSIVNPLIVEMEVVGRNFGRAFITIDRLLSDGTYERVINNEIQSVARDELGNVIRVNTWADGVDGGISDWNVQGSELSDGTHRRIVLTTLSEDSFSLEGRYRTSADSEWFDVSLILPRFTETSVSSVISKNPDLGSAGVISIPAGAEFQVYMTLVSEDGQTQTIPDETITFIWQEPEGLSLKDVPMPSGSYQAGFLVETFNGEQASEVVPIAVNNDGLDLPLRGYTNLNAGYTITLNETWGYAFNDNLFNYYDIPSVDSPEFLRIYHERRESDTYFGTNVITPQGILDKYGYDLLSQDIIRVNGEDLDVFIYSDLFNLGVGVFYPALNGDALFFSIEIQNKNFNPSRLINRLKPILESLNLFNSRDYFDNRNNIWERWDFGDKTSETPGGQYQIRKDWRANQYWDGMWLVSVPDSTENPYTSTTFHKVAKVDATDATRLRDAILSDVVQPNSTNFAITQTRTYYAQLMTWQVALYTLERDGTPIMGRVYAGVRGDNQNYVIWQEAPADIAPDLFTNTFEIMVDAFFPTNPLRVYSLSDYGFKLNYPQSFDFFAGTISPDVTSSIYTVNQSQTLEYWIDFYPNATTLEEALAEWITFGYRIVEPPQEVVYNGKSGLRFRFQFAGEQDLYDGYAFITLSADGTKGVGFNPMWVNTPADLAYFEWLMNNNYYGVTAEPPVIDETQAAYRPHWRTEKYDEIGLEMGVLGMWNTTSIYRQVTFTYPYLIIDSPEYIPAPTTFYLYIILSEEDFDEVWILSDPRSTDVMIDGVMGKQNIIQFDETSWCSFIVFTSENGITYAMEFFGDTREQVTMMMADFIPTVDTYPVNLYELELLAESTDAYAISPITDWLTERIDPIGLEFGVQSSWIVEPISDTFDVNNAYYRAFSPNSVPTTFFIYVTDSIDYVAMAELWTTDYTDVTIAGVNGKRFLVGWNDTTWSEMITFTSDNGFTYRLEFWGYETEYSNTLMNELIPLISTYPPSK